MPDVRVWRPGLVLQAEELTVETVVAIREALEPEQAVGLTAWAEARSRLEPGRGWVENPLAAMVDVICVVGNRAHDPRWSALGWKGVVLARAQFSCWAPHGGPENYRAVLDRAQRLVAGEASAKLRGCVEAARGAMRGDLISTVGPATHYFAPASMVPPGRVPGWVAGATLTAERFGHKYYAGVK